ncbi:hypothetical protein PISL3812_00841 [Talaromyces islandicus]|uniref:Uncharacterized protein n=1 Tax=Talaromyces islandicus TaxID=28573 RepID=A0A0U1LMG1_TALIS|nr:hypothetical protein PISL3812_00841 [Talaromyces islandicus]
MSPTQSSTLVLQRNSPPRKSMIPISTITRLWKPAKEPDTSTPGSSKTPRRVTRSPKSKEQRVLPHETNTISQNDDPFIADDSPLRAGSSRLPSRAHVENCSVSEGPKPVQAPNVALVSSHTLAGKKCDQLPNIPDEPIFLGEDFAALLKVANIRNKESIWVDLWIPIRAGDRVIPLDAQYLSSLKSFLGLQYLKVTGMLKSYQKEIFRAVWKMELLEYLDLRMAEEPQLSPGVYWRRIEKGWDPRRHEPQNYQCPGNGKGRVARRFGVAEYLDNSVIELAREKHHDGLGDFEKWSNKKLSVVHLTLRGFVVDALPFFSCFDENRLRQITFTDCYDAGFCLPADLIDEVEINVGGFEPATVVPVHHIPKELKSITIKEGKIVEKQPVRPRCHQRVLDFREAAASHAVIVPPQYSPGKNPHRHVTIGGQTYNNTGARLSLFSWRRRKHNFNLVLEEEEEEY